MFLLQPAYTYEARFPSKARIQKLWDTLVPVINGKFTDSVCSSLPPPWAKRASISPKALHIPLLLHNQARWAKAWVEVEARAHKPRLQGPKGVSMPSHLRSSLRTSRSFKVHFYSLPYGQEYCLIMVHLIPLLLHHVWKIWA